MPGTRGRRGLVATRQPRARRARRPRPPPARRTPRRRRSSGSDAVHDDLHPARRRPAGSRARSRRGDVARADDRDLLEHEPRRGQLERAADARSRRPRPARPGAPAARARRIVSVAADRVDHDVEALLARARRAARLQLGSLGVDDARARARAACASARARDVHADGTRARGDRDLQRVDADAAEADHRDAARAGDHAAARDHRPVGGAERAGQRRGVDRVDAGRHQQQPVERDDHLLLEAAGLA